MGRNKNKQTSSAPADLVDDEFIKFFNGKEGIAGKAKGYDDAVEWLEDGAHKRKIFTCIVFYEKPIEFLSSGKTKDGKKGDGKKVDDKLINYLPMHAGELQEEVAAREIKKFGAFAKVNFTMVRRIALLALQKGWAEEGMAKQWEVAYGGTPMKITFDNSKWNGMADETKKIKQEGIQMFKDEREYWMDLELDVE
jgi:hypothetical protein